MDAEQLKNQNARLKAYVVAIDGSVTPELLPRGTVVRAAIANFASQPADLSRHGLDSGEAAEVQSAFAQIDQTAVGMAAITPHLDELCRRMGEGDADTVALAGLWDAVNESENEAHLQAYNAVYNGLSPRAQAAVDSVIAERNATSQTSRVRWADAAREVPEIVRLMLENACKRWNARSSPDGLYGPGPFPAVGPQSQQA